MHVSYMRSLARILLHSLGPCSIRRAAPSRVPQGETIVLLMSSVVAGVVPALLEFRNPKVASYRLQRWVLEVDGVAIESNGDQPVAVPPLVAVIEAAPQATLATLATPRLDDEEDGMAAPKFGFQLGNRHLGVRPIAQSEAFGRALNGLRVRAEAVIGPEGSDELPFIVGADPVVLADRLQAGGAAGIGGLLRRVGNGDADGAGWDGPKVTGHSRRRLAGW
jgi:hypothetical protein